MSDARRMIRERKDAIDKDTVDAYTKRIERKLLLRRHETNQLLPPQDMSSYQLDYLDRLQLRRWRQQIERGDGDRTGSDSDSNVGSPPPNIMDIY
ncbi:hypothetical protein P154DRAFT_522167 [Amniculicola lignicola CBS 123094]|uniref:Uncharacterized protein n=1 Tax=Amniculicola lignicola CBS 123094 TaxID=1392246 RepID=A0A6A5WG71_9PLEO|nr:hypothetical protein P154DRAFT_522167 [Amniculicola lignicola CBS 123094]